MKKVNCITINTDASFHPEKKVGGYAFYIICDFFKITKSAKFKANPKNSLQAELWCIANAIAILLKQPDLPATPLIVINTDCLYGIERVKRKSLDEDGKTIFFLLKKLKKATSNDSKCIFTKHEFRHVKAHNGAPDKRSWVNEWCDANAKIQMREAAANITL